MPASPMNDDDPYADLIAALRRDAGDDPEQLLELAVTLAQSSNRLLREGEGTEALVPARESAEVFERLAAADPDAFTLHLATAVAAIARLLYQTEAYAKSVGVWRRAIELYQRTTGEHAPFAQAEQVEAMTGMAMAFAGLGSLAEAARLKAEADAIEQTLSEEQAIALYSVRAKSADDHTAYLFSIGEDEDALAVSEFGARFYRDLAAALPEFFLSPLAGMLQSRTEILMELDRPEEALEAIREAVQSHAALEAQFPGEDPQGYAGCEHMLCTVLTALGRDDEAVQLAAAALKRMGAEPPA